MVSSDGLPQSLGPTSDQHLDQRARLPGRRADEGLQDQAFAIDQHRDFLSILAIEGGEGTHQLERYVALGVFGLKSLCIEYDASVETVNHRVAHIKGNAAVTQPCCVPPCP